MKLTLCLNRMDLLASSCEFLEFDIAKWANEKADVLKKQKARMEIEEREGEAARMIAMMGMVRSQDATTILNDTTNSGNNYQPIDPSSRVRNAWRLKQRIRRIRDPGGGGECPVISNISSSRRSSGQSVHRATSLINSHPIPSTTQHAQATSSTAHTPETLRELATHSTSNPSYLEPSSEPLSFSTNQSSRELSAQDLGDVFTSITASRTATAQDQAQQLIDLMREQNIVLSNIQHGQEMITAQLENLNKTFSAFVTQNSDLSKN